MMAENGDLYIHFFGVWFWLYGFASDSSSEYIYYAIVAAIVDDDGNGGEREERGERERARTDGGRKKRQEGVGSGGLRQSFIYTCSVVYVCVCKK